jgi:hypothetical protein
MPTERCCAPQATDLQRQSTNPKTSGASFALRAAIPCVTLFPFGAQAGVMPADGELVEAAAAGRAEEVGTLIAGGASIEENDAVSDGARAGIERFRYFFFVLKHSPVV